MVDNKIMPCFYFPLTFPIFFSLISIFCWSLSLCSSLIQWDFFFLFFDWTVCWVSRIKKLNNSLFFITSPQIFMGKISLRSAGIKAIWGQKVKCQVIFEVSAGLPWFQNNVSKLQSPFYFFFSFFFGWVKHPLLVFKDQTFLKELEFPLWICYRLSDSHAMEQWLWQNDIMSF